MTYTALVTMIIVVQYLLFQAKTALARVKSGIKAPAMTGDETFERCNRIQMNTLEHLPLILPSLWLCAEYFSEHVAVVLGSVFIIGRFIYSYSYLRQPSSRSTGMIIGYVSILALIGCTFWGIIL